MTPMLRPFSRQDGIIYGPVSSRRFGSSLGINTLPGVRKLCSFECPYCQLGSAETPFEKTLPKIDLPTPQEVAQALEESLLELGSVADRLNCLTFSGNGEPTAHPEFPGIVSEVRKVRSRLAPNARIVLLTNAAHLERPGMIAALDECDDVVAKIDAGTEGMFRKIDRPAAGITLEKIVRDLQGLRRVVVQTMFVTGTVDNTSDDEISAWIGHLKSVRPASIQIYTLDRIPADRSILPVEPERLREIARRVLSEVGVEPTVAG
jgi:wyosine [tRNA(Phe)-imidazoG37] synthetase (radical SAM superfamily)